MKQQRQNYAFIDGQNVNLSIRQLGWQMDFRRFRIYLREKYGVQKAYYFIGYVEGNNDLYNSLQSYGYILVFKPTFRGPDGIKGNVDADLVLQAMIDFGTYHQAVIVTGDGDFYSLIHYLREEGKLLTLLVPNEKKYSGLLKKSAQNHIAFLNHQKKKLEYRVKKKKTR